jgi:hypothetical protein
VPPSGYQPALRFCCKHIPENKLGCFARLIRVLYSWLSTLGPLEMFVFSPKTVPETPSSQNRFSHVNAPDKSIYVVLLATLLVFGMGLKSSFHFDDNSLFTDAAVTSSSGWWEVWRPLRTRPLTYFTFWLNYQLGGQNPVGYHAVNLALHLLAVWLLYGILNRLAGARAALIAAVIFAIHPIQSEPVLYVFERATLISTIFCLLCWRSWLASRNWSAVGWFALAVLSKEECVTFPLFLLIFRRAYLPCATMMSLSFAAGIRVLVNSATLHVQAVRTHLYTASQPPASPLAYADTIVSIILRYFEMSLMPYLCTQGIVILHYFRILLLPYGLTIDPDVPLVLDWRGWLAWVAILATATFLWKKWRYGKWIGAGLILLAPSSSIFPAADLAADRRLYLPMVAFAALAGLLLEGVKRWMILAPVAVGLSAMSFVRSMVWLNEQTLWTEAVARAPRKVRPLLQLSRASDAETALRILDNAQAIAPDDPRPVQEKGLRLLAANRPDLALVQFERALALAPNDLDLLNGRGVAHTFLGQRDAAVEDFTHALSIDPCQGTARRNLERLGMTYAVPCQ